MKLVIYPETKIVFQELTAVTYFKMNLNCQESAAKWYNAPCSLLCTAYPPSASAQS